MTEVKDLVDADSAAKLVIDLRVADLEKAIRTAEQIGLSVMLMMSQDGRVQFVKKATVIRPAPIYRED